MRRSTLQILAAAAGAMIIPLVWAFQVEPGPPNADGSPDNGPAFGAFAFIMFAPVWLLLLSMYWAAVVALLRLLGSLRLVPLLVVNLLPSTCLGLAYAFDRSEYGFRHAAESFAFVALWTVASLSLGSLAWWILNKHRTPVLDASGKAAA